VSSDYKVAILGAGLGGLGLAHLLLQQGERAFVILEKSDRVGGTWRDNSYPGCSCDVAARFYWYSFDKQPDWTRAFAFQPEILGHIEEMVERRGLREHIRFGARVVEAAWDEAAQVWRIRTASGEQIVAEHFVCACGQLSQPTFRGIEGREHFVGISFHSARWRHDVDLTGKRVAVIGSGASAAQLVPEVAKIADRLTVFQRTPPYVIPREDHPFTEEERRLYQTDAAYLQESRDAIYRDLENRFETLKPGSEVARAAEKLCGDFLEAQVHDPELREKLRPRYTIGCKRPIISDDYLATFNRPNVSLITERLEQIEKNGVRTADGALHEVDAIVYATGFESLKFLDGLRIVGRRGRLLHQDAWREAPEAYLGMLVAGFPNFFILYGPNTNLNHNSIIAMFEAQYGYILQALRLAEDSAVAIDVRPEVMAAFNEQLQRGLQESAFVTGCNSWYRTKEGRIVTNWWGNVEAYKARTARLDPGEYELLGAGRPAEMASPGRGF
jgi:cation diffusion facilitator CzcD-associated flavoprotein CzcO